MILEDQISCEQCGFPHVAVHFRPDEYQSATCPICGWTMTWDEEAEDFVILEGVRLLDDRVSRSTWRGRLL